MSQPEIEVTPADDVNETLTFTVEEGDVGVRLDAFLASKIETWSRSRIQRLIDNGDVLVLGKIAKSSHKLRAGDLLDVELTPATPSLFPPENIPLDIVYEDDDLVVVNKPAGLIVHPGAGIPGGTLANALAYHFQELAEISARRGTIRPGIVHRLDKNTSGLLVVAKTEAAHESLSDQFSSRAVFKSYLALVHGQMAKDEEQIAEPIGRDPKHRTRMAVVRGGRPAQSRYRVRERYDRFSLLEVAIKTGRTHQIRVHLAFIKHPVIGDELYGSGRDKTVADPVIRSRINKLGRLFLHAEQLAFNHPRSGERMKFEVPIPAELSALLEILV